MRISGENRPRGRVSTKLGIAFRRAPATAKRTARPASRRVIALIRGGRSGEVFLRCGVRLAERIVEGGQARSASGEACGTTTSPKVRGWASCAMAASRPVRNWAASDGSCGTAYSSRSVGRKSLTELGPGRRRWAPVGDQRGNTSADASSGGATYSTSGVKSASASSCSSATADVPGR